MRGKDAWSSVVMDISSGSPPLARERPVVLGGGALRARITPACAGKTHQSPSPGKSCRDHPRLRGKDGSMPFLTRMRRGSPPLARERLPIIIPPTVCKGITPACAGKTIYANHYKKRQRDHPRLRGKDYSLVSYKVAMSGSPPLARERQIHDNEGISYSGITPACAGKTTMTTY